MGIISKPDALAELQPYLDVLLECFEVAWQKWRDDSPQLFAKPKASLRAAALHGLIEEQVRMRLGAEPRLRIIEKGQRFLLGVHGRMVLRFKKLDEEYRTRTYPTRTARCFDAQGPLPTLEEAADLPRVTVGYRLNQLATQLLEVVVVFSVDKEVCWLEPLHNGGAVQELLFEPKSPAPTQDAGTTRRDKSRRVTLKGTPPSKDGEGGTQ